MRLRRIAISGFLVLVSAPSLADEAVDAIQLTYHNLTDLRAEFTQRTVVEALGKAVQNHGTLFLKRPGKLRLEYEGNPKRQYISDGKTLWVATAGDNQYQVYPVGGGAVPREALQFLHGFGELTRTFQVEAFAPPKRERDNTYLRLRPRGRSSYRQLDCEFDERSLLVGLTIYNPSGNQTTYRFTNVAINSGLSAGLFRFSPPPGARAVPVGK